MPAKIYDEFYQVRSRQARRYFRKKKAGLCVRCCQRKKLEPYEMCAECREYRKQHYLCTRKLRARPYKHTARKSKHLITYADTKTRLGIG